MKKLRARDGHEGDPKKAAAAQPQESPALMPLDFALTFMRDGAKPDALRVSTAKLAASLLPKPAAEDKPGTQPEVQAQSQTWSDFELARRILHILHYTDQMLEEQEALGDAVPERDRINPVEKVISQITEANFVSEISG